MSVSIGVVGLTQTGSTVADVMVDASDACYVAREKGHERIHVSEADDDRIACRRDEIRSVARLREAIDRKSFVLFAQPIISLDPEQHDRRHFEILLRMKNEKGKLLAPGAFLPAAERYGLIGSIDRWVAENAIEAIAGVWAERDRAPIHSVSINLSGASLGDETFLCLVKGVLERHSIPTRILCFEITETLAIANFNSAMRFVNELKEIGCRFALDDFGSGFSSFNYLKTLPVDYLKIDGSFVRKMAEDSQDAAMVEAINNIGHVMGLQTIAEFVEDAQTLERLRALGVDYAQGYHLGKPQPLYELCYEH